MKIVFIGYDYTFDLAARLIEDGHEIIKIYTFPCDNVFAFNIQIKDFANYHDIPITEQKITTENIEHDIARGAELFFSAGYPYKIPQIKKEQAYAMNMHPTLLPRARGMMPLPHVILNEPNAAGFTIHKITNEYDSGDIIYQEPIQIDETTDVETLSARIALRANSAIPDIVKDIKNLWDNASAQDNNNASKAPLPDEDFRTINWDSATKDLEKQSRAFGRFGMIANVTNNVGQTQKLAVYQFSVWHEDHEIGAGKLLRSSPKEIIITTSDGYACLKDFTPIS